jgi:16S rRNA (cytosine967-C5)-methyltransferase
MVSAARRCAFTVLRRTFEQGAYTDRALRAQAARARLEGRDLALATQLALGTVQRRATLDHLVEVLSERPVERLDPPTLAALRLGLFQLCFLDGVASHAVVDESVQLAKAGRGGGHRLVNAVLRRAVAEARPLVGSLDDATPEAAAIKHSHPEWVARLWWEALGPREARALMAAGNHPPESAIRANTLVADAERVAAELARSGVATHPAQRLPEGLVVDRRFDLQASPLWDAGAMTAQSRASMLVSRIVAPEPGERVLDLCAAPGAKATHLAALTEGRGEVVAVERRPARAGSLSDNAARMRARNVRVRVGDARYDQGRDFDRVLVDAPCSGLGTLSARPDLRWRAAPEAVDRLAQLQGEILTAATRAVRPGGVLVYSTCTISPEENELQVERLLVGSPQLRADDLQSEYPLWKHPGVDRHLLLMPHRDATQGFFIARLRRSAATR